MDTINIVDAAIAHDKDSFMQAFNAAIANKVGDALEIKKVEVASNLLNPQPETVDNGTEEIQAEVGGAESAAETSSAE